MMDYDFELDLDKLTRSKVGARHAVPLRVIAESVLTPGPLPAA